jgi:RNA polymerase sigma-70 factor, ECF subfamily
LLRPANWITIKRVQNLDEAWIGSLARLPGWQEADTVLDRKTAEEQVREVFLALRKPIYGYLCGVLGNRTEAEDLTQETFIRLFNRMTEGETIGNFRAWLFRVAHNLAMDNWKRGQREEQDALLPDSGALRSEEKNAEEEILQQEQTLERSAWMTQALRRLSPQERQCLEMRAEGLRYREIADVMGLRIPTVQTLLSRAIGKMARPGVRR